MTELRTYLQHHFTQAGIVAEPEVASVTFVGLHPIDVLRFGPDHDGTIHYVSVGGSRYSEGTPAEVTMSIRGPLVASGIARSVAVLAAAPAIEGLVMTDDALIDLGQPLWRGAPFTAVLLGDSDIPTAGDVRFLRATPLTQNEAAWVRLKGPDAMRKAWLEDSVDVLDATRAAARPR